jgi:hypothetical protein
MKLQLLLKLYSIILVNIYEKYRWNFNIEINTIITIVLIYIWKFKYKYHKYNKIIQCPLFFFFFFLQTGVNSINIRKIINKINIILFKFFISNYK